MAVLLNGYNNMSVFLKGFKTGLTYQGEYKPFLVGWGAASGKEGFGRRRYLVIHQRHREVGSTDMVDDIVTDVGDVGQLIVVVQLANQIDRRGTYLGFEVDSAGAAYKRVSVRFVGYVDDRVEVVSVWQVAVVVVLRQVGGYTVECVAVFQNLNFVAANAF